MEINYKIPCLEEWFKSTDHYLKGLLRHSPMNLVEYQKARRKNQPELYVAYTAKRHAAKLQRVPKWFGEFDEFVILEAAKLSKDREKATGFKWNVDHMVPLQGKTVSGFHIGCNIQVIPKIENIKKGNRSWPNMP
jgi:hypothetical protein